MRYFEWTVLILLLGLTAGCDGLSGLGENGLDADNAATATVDGLKIYFSAPDTVAPRDSFEVRFVVLNRTFENMTVVTSNSCLVTPGIFEDTGFGVGARTPFKGSVIGCLMVATEHDIPAGKALKRTFDMQAVLPGYDEREDEPAPPGHYVIRAGLDWTLGERNIELSGIERRLTVHR